MLIDNLPNIAKIVEDFYLSPLRETMVLNVNLLNPINEILELNINKLSSYQETLDNVVARIKLYVSCYSQITNNNNNISKTFVFNDIKSRNDYIKILKQTNFRQYLSKYQLSGKTTIL